MTRDPWLDQVRFGPDGLVPVVAQDHRNGNVLMLAWANREALERSEATGEAHYWSRSRQSLWRKGETSGHTQRIREIRLDCDGDTVLYRVDQTGPACHTGQVTCFSTVVRAGETGSQSEPGGHLLTRLAATIRQRALERPADSYTVKLLDKGAAKAAQKVGEEAVEVVIAANTEHNGRLASESADLLYHLLVLLEARRVPLDDVLRVLEEREK
ncbi:MAG TPA: bifunctional phosphoribosyl-AMP cyclohydrolase/phosphoribosyl-ATP diphosphatase HisIE [Gemmatimonadales bacterium]|nr:bifunctional phosphoribosyl-AMP cyclohydrolase/phosphoribosyl-ATP diphosphatase HisIE [Gemmatimonadales bacterium]